MANTFIELNDVPSSYSGKGLTFVRINGDENGLSFAGADLDTLGDVEASGAYAPSGQQILQYSAGAGKWRPVDNDPYSAGNGLVKTASTFDVVAAVGGGLTSNTSGVYITDIANVEGTYGNASYIPQFTVNSKGQITSISNVALVAETSEALQADYVGNVNGTSGQIRVVGGTGNNSNATIDLVATGVTAGTYGNATTVPQITVDTYGRIQNIDLVAGQGGGSGSGNAGLAFDTIVVAGQTNVSAETAEDNLTLVAGSGISITTDAANDAITFTANTTSISSSVDLGDLQNVNVDGITDGQFIRWVSANSAFEAFTITDQTGIALADLSAGTGLDYNSSTGEFKLANTAVSAGTYGNSVVVPQITVDAQGRITNISNVSQAPSGVTAGVYGNATLVPQITVDEYGIVTDISTVSSAQYTQSLSWNATSKELALSNGGNTVDLEVLNQNLFNTISVAGQNNITADSPNDSLTFAAGSGINITTNSVTDVITISATNIGGGGNSNVGLGDFSVTTGAASSGGALSYNGNGVFTFNPADLTGLGNQNLSYNSGTQTLSISDGNSVDLSGSLDNVDSQAISLSGNVISITGDASTVDLTSVLGSVAGNYGDSNVASYLSAQGYATQSTIVAAITDSAPGTLDTLNELAAALGDDPNFATTVTNSLATKANISSLANVATSGDYTDISNRPTIALSGSDLTYDGTTLDLSGVGATGPQGDAGSDGSDGIGITNATVSSNELLITYSNTTVQNLGNIRGPKGDTGDQGIQGNAGTDGTDGVDGSDGADGSDGVGVTNVSLVSGNLVFTYSNTSTQDVGNIQGPQGDQGIQGDTGPAGPTGPTGPQGNVGAQGPAGNVLVTTANTAPSGASEGQMWYATDDAHTYIYHNSNWVSANPGESPQTLSLAGNVITISGSNSNVDLTTILGAVDTNTDAQTLNLSGNTLTISGSGSSVDLSSFAGGGGSNYQTLGMTGTDITISGGNGVDIAQAVRDTTDAHLNQSNPTSGYVLSWNGSDYAWVAQTGGDVVDDTTPQLGGDLDVNGRDIVSTSNGDIDLNPDGSGQVVFRGNSTRGAGQFKLNCEANSHGVTIKGPAHSAAASYTLTLPDNDGDADQVLKTDGSGNLAWVDQNSSASLGSLSDVSTAGASSGQVLKYNGSSWAPAADGGGGGVEGAVIERFKLNYLSSGNLGSISDTTSGISNVSIDSASGGDVTVNFNSSSYNHPPASIMIYGYAYSSNKYLITPFESTMGLREIAGGGSSGSPTLFDGTGSVSVKLRLRESETGASRSFGTVTHAWIQFVMYD